MNFKTTDMNWIKNILGITELIEEQKQTKRVLIEIEKQTKRTADLQEKNNKAYHIN